MKKVLLSLCLLPNLVFANNLVGRILEENDFSLNVMLSDSSSKYELYYDELITTLVVIKKPKVNPYNQVFSVYYSAETGLCTDITLAINTREENKHRKYRVIYRLDESDINCEKILKEVYELTQESYNEF
jgi:hypothetical protein